MTGNSPWDCGWRKRSDWTTARWRDLAAFRGETVHAIAAIGYPDRFFAQLGTFGIDVIPSSI